MNESEERLNLRQSLMENLNKWTYHSVIIVDMSGSMRRDDINGGRCRSDAVWLALARNHIKVPLENGDLSPTTDLVSIIIMRDEAEILFSYQPADWYLYNKIVGLREWDSIRPYGDGNYMPALKAAELLFDRNSYVGALSLIFFSDGKPSDPRANHRGMMGELASKYGRRLSVACIGIASDDEVFFTLRGLVEEADSYGCHSYFNKASLDVDSMSNIISSLSSSVALTKTEITDVQSGKLRSIRSDIRREKKNEPEDLHITCDWNVYKGNSICSFWVWNREQRDFVVLFDYRCFHCGKDTRAFGKTTPKENTIRCNDCCCAYFCDKRCFTEGMRDHKRGTDTLASCRFFKRMRLNNGIIHRDFPTYSLAIKKHVFGEGSERVVSKVRFLDPADNFFGEKFVAKDSRFVREGSYKDHLQFHKSFLRTQSIASKMADRFNSDIDKLVSTYKMCNYVKFQVKRIPRIRFLEPMVGEFQPDNGPTFGVLIEPFLEGDYVKFNNNMGYVKDTSGKVTEEKAMTNGEIDLGLVNELRKMEIVDSNPLGGVSGLGVIDENDEEEEGDDDDDEYGKEFDKGDTQKVKDRISMENDEDLIPFPIVYPKFNDLNIPQVFSHYSYEQSRHKYIVVDLQGVLQDKPDGRKFFELTDPAVHNVWKTNK